MERGLKVPRDRSSACLRGVGRMWLPGAGLWCRDLKRKKTREQSPSANLEQMPELMKVGVIWFPPELLI